jgi:predicted DCC family thiol-disulfide oxidoreductase YuxK
MAEERAQAPSGAGGVHLVLYDGVCGLCNRLVQFLLTHDRGAVFSFAPLQGPTGKSVVARFGGNPDDLTTFYICANFRTPDARVLTKSDAALFVARELSWPWKALTAAHVVPKVLRDALYVVVARTRYRVFGRYEQCLAPRPEFRSRFVE